MKSSPRSNLCSGFPAAWQPRSNPGQVWNTPVAGVQTRVVEERETVNGQLVELSRNYFATSKSTGDVYYFGEDVDTYRDGKLTGHGGSWRAGLDGAKFGLMMPAKPQVGQRFY